MEGELLDEVVFGVLGSYTVEGRSGNEGSVGGGEVNRGAAEGLKTGERGRGRRLGLEAGERSEKKF